MTDIRPSPAASEVVVHSDCMVRLYEVARRVAATPLPVLLTGETGTGKEHVAHAVHAASPRAARPFVALNCGALPATLLEGALFGHARGAFTGAESAARGAFEQAAGGTLFLDEVGELGLPAQAALLRVLETGCVRPLGSPEDRRVDTRVVAATNRDLERMIEQQLFRRDLLYRINAVTLALPPLRKRRQEIEPLARHFLELARRRFGSRMHDIDPEALERLRAYHWPGNVRELRNLIESRAALCAGPVLRVEDLPDLPSHPAERPRQVDAIQVAADYRSRLRAYETELLLDGLRRAGGNQCRAAELLDMPRRTLCRRLKELGIQRQYGAA